MGVLVFMLFLFELVTCLNVCPPTRVIQPCTCKSGEEDFFAFRGIMTCTGISSDEQVESILSESRQYSIRELTFASCELRYLPSDGFVDTQYEDIYIINSTVGALTETDIAFEGLENSLNVLRVENSRFLNSWDWNSLRNVNNLFELFIINTDLVYIPASFKKLPYTVERLVITGNPMDSIADGAFSSFRIIVEISLRGNRITDLKRNMFPEPAGSLRTLDLSYNKLGMFPDDMFVKMPKLQVLDLSGNPIKTLDEEIFHGIWGNLLIFTMKDTHLRCDCHLTWISKGANFPARDKSECQHPSRLKGRALSSLRTKDLLCY